MHCNCVVLPEQWGKKKGATHSSGVSAGDGWEDGEDDNDLLSDVIFFSIFQRKDWIIFQSYRSDTQPVCSLLILAISVLTRTNWVSICKLTWSEHDLWGMLKKGLFNIKACIGIRTDYMVQEGLQTLYNQMFNLQVWWVPWCIHFFCAPGHWFPPALILEFVQQEQQQLHTHGNGLEYVSLHMLLLTYFFATVALTPQGGQFI